MRKSPKIFFFKKGRGRRQEKRNFKDKPRGANSLSQKQKINRWKQIKKAIQENFPELKGTNSHTRRAAKGPAQWAPSTKAHNHHEISELCTLREDPTCL